MRISFLLLSMLHFTVLFVMGQTQENSKNSDDYVLFDGKDTIFCYFKKISYTLRNLNGLDYIDNQGNAVEVSHNEIKSVKAYRVGGFEFERTPPEIAGNKVHFHTSLYFNPCMVKINERYEELSGKVKLLSSGSYVQIKFEKNGDRKVTLTTDYKALAYVVKFEDSSYHFISKSDYKDVVLAKLNQCEEFKNAYKAKAESGDVFFKKGTHKDVSRHVSLYNQVCK